MNSSVLICHTLSYLSISLCPCSVNDSVHCIYVSLFQHVPLFPSLFLSASKKHLHLDYWTDNVSKSFKYTLFTKYVQWNMSRYIRYFFASSAVAVFAHFNNQCDQFVSQAKLSIILILFIELHIWKCRTFHLIIELYFSHWLNEKNHTFDVDESVNLFKFQLKMCQNLMHSWEEEKKKIEEKQTLIHWNNSNVHKSFDTFGMSYVCV